MRIKNTLVGIIISLCISNIAFAKNSDNTEPNTVKPQIEGNKMLPLAAKKGIVEDFSEYAYTAEILRKHFYTDPEKIRTFLHVAKATGLTLDKLFLGLNDSKRFTENEQGYTEAQKAEGIALLEKLIDQQFTKANPSANPTYTVYPGSPGAGKTYLFIHDFVIDVANNKFAADAITIGPDLVVMAQMDKYKQACTLPIGEQRTAAMIAAYSIDRDLSNACANFMLVKALAEKYNIKHDSNMSANNSGKILDCIGKLGYTRIGRVLMVDRKSKGQALDIRTAQNGGFALVTNEDALGKGKLALARLADRTFINRFEYLSIYVHQEGFALKKSLPIKVATYNNELQVMEITTDGQEHIDRILQQAQESENLTAEEYADLAKEFDSWKKPEVIQTARATNGM